MLEDVNDGRLLLNVVYISSDRSEDQYASYLSKLAGAEGVLAVPFSSTELRADLKRRFKTCAGSEQAELGIEERLRGIPNVVLVGAGGEIVKEDATADVEGYRGVWPEGWPES